MREDLTLRAQPWQAPRSNRPQRLIFAGAEPRSGMFVAVAIRRHAPFSRTTWHSPNSDSFLCPRMQSIQAFYRTIDRFVQPERSLLSDETSIVLRSRA